MFDVETALELFGLRKNTHTPLRGSLLPSVRVTRFSRLLEGEGATPVRSISADRGGEYIQHEQEGSVSGCLLLPDTGVSAS